MLTLSKFKFYAFVLLCFPLLAVSMPLDQCIPYPFLKQGFDFSAYEKCTTLLQQCSASLPNHACVNQVVIHHAACSQLKKLADKLNAAPDAIKVEAAANKFIIVKHSYRADGQEDYAIISPQACLVSPKLYPQNYNRIFKTHRKKIDFYPQVMAPPRYTLRTNGTQSFIIPLRIRNICAACEVLGEAQASMDFTEKGQFIQTRLEPR